MTYRQLLEAIKTANELQAEVDRVSLDRRRWNGTAEEQDDAEALFRAADNALDQEAFTETIDLRKQKLYGLRLRAGELYTVEALREVTADLIDLLMEENDK